MILLLTFLQALCEKQFSKMQNFLREQKREEQLLPKPFDFLNYLRHIMNNYYKIMTKQNLSVGGKALDLIVELIQGDVKENITSLLHKTFIYDLCRILTDFNTRYHLLPRGFELNQFSDEFRDFKGNVIFCFKTMLENNDERNTEILREHLDFKGLLRTFEDLMNYFQESKSLKYKDSEDFIAELENEDFREGALGNAVNIYIIFRYVWEDTDAFNEKIKSLIEERYAKDMKKQENLTKLINLFKKIVGSVEIIDDFKEPSLIRIWFPVIAVSHYLNDDVKDSFITHVDRSNTQSKITSLVDSAAEFIP